FHVTGVQTCALPIWAAWWYRWTGSGDDRRPVDALPPVHVVKDMMAAREHSGSEGMPLPVIARLVEAPVFGADGSLRTQPGYHERSEERRVGKEAATR